MTRTGKLPSLFNWNIFGCMARIRLGMFLILCLTANSVWAAEIQVQATVDKRNLTLEDSITLSIQVEGVRSAPRPKLPPLDAFQIRSQGTSSSIQIINGRQTSSTTFNYLLIPNGTGSFTIGPAIIEINGRKYQTAPITVIVHKPSDKVDTSREVFAELSVSSHTPYIGEQVTATLRIYHRVAIRNLNLNLQFLGFREEKLQEPIQNTRVLKGIRYRVYEVSTALFPMRAGRIEIPAGRIELEQEVPGQNGYPPNPIDPFGPGSIFDHGKSFKHKILRTDSLTLEVQPLPRKNRPENFSNLVGEFYITRKLSRTEVEVGDTATLTVTVAGSGNLKHLVLNPPDWGENIKVYPGQSVYHPVPGTRILQGEKIFTYVLVPQKPGELEIPFFSLTYFNPTQKEYATARSSAIKLKVLPGKGGSELKVVEPDSENSAAGKVSVPKAGEDILPIHIGSELYENQNFSGVLRWWYGLGMVLPGVLFLFYRWSWRLRYRLKHDIAFSRSYKAYKNAVKQLDAVTPGEDDRDTARELSFILREYLGNILNAHGTAITASEIKDFLKRGNFSREQIDAAEKLLKKYESLQYAATSEQHSDQLVQESRALLDLLEKNS